MPELSNNLYSAVSVADMAECRERRAYRQLELIRAFNLPVVSFTLNIAGPIKNSVLIEFGFELGLDAILNELNGSVVKIERTVEKTGCEALIVVNRSANVVKTQMMQIEEDSSIGRWYDIDVIDTSGDKLSRPKPRKCIICGENASVCARSRAHSVDILTKCTKKAFIGVMADYIGNLACSALYDEVHLTPKPGLVDELNSGANSDMDIVTFERSIEAIRPFFSQMAATALDNPSNGSLLMNRLQIIGMDAERAMLEATGGVNTHRGAIYSVGLLISAFAVLIADNLEFKCLNFETALVNVAAELSKKQMILESGVSNGARVRKIYGVSGPREQAAEGFPIARQVLRKYEEYSQKGYGNPWIAVLLLAMVLLDDNNCFKRGGLEGAAFVKRRAAELLELNQELSNEKLMIFDDQLIKRNISCGGAADTLAVAMLIKKIRDTDIVNRNVKMLNCEAQ